MRRVSGSSIFKSGESGAKGILLTPNDSSALVPVITEARKAGLLTIALDTSLDPANAADATFATDNFKAGELVGKWAAGALGDKSKDAKIALLNLNAQQITVDYMRNQGFLTGFGVDVKNPQRIGDEDDKRIIGNAVTNANEDGGRTGMESLLQVDPEINLVYTINEPTTADTNLIDTAADARRMTVEAECANVGLMFDTCHIAYEGRSLSSYVADMGSDLVHLHAADTDRKAIGEGDMDWDELLGALVGAHYQGYFAVETGFGSRHIDPVEVARQSLLYIKSKLPLTSPARRSAV